MNDLPDILREYKSHMLVIKADSPKTVDQYLLDLSLFLKWLKITRAGGKTDAETFEKTTISDVTGDLIASVGRSDILEFLVYAASERGNGAKARARKLSSIKSFFKYLTVTTHRLDSNPAADIDTPTVRPALPKFLELEECRRASSSRAPAPCSWSAC